MSDSVFAVDLAYVRSGFCLFDPDRGVGGACLSTSQDVAREHGDRQVYEDLLIRHMESQWPGTHMVIEDMPVGMPNSRLVKDTYRFQGQLFRAYRTSKLPPLTVTWVRPDTWQRAMGVWKKGKWAAVDKAKEFGFLFPEGHDIKGQSDMADACLIAGWLYNRIVDGELGPASNMDYEDLRTPR